MKYCNCKSDIIKTIKHKCPECQLETESFFDENIELKKIDLVNKMLDFIKEQKNGTENKD